jgi:hypothetical protein
VSRSKLDGMKLRDALEKFARICFLRICRPGAALPPQMTSAWTTPRIAGLSQSSCGGAASLFTFRFISSVRLVAGLFYPQTGLTEIRLMMNGTVLRHGARIAAFLGAFACAAPAARCQEFARRSIECGSLDCAASGKSYSFHSLPETQEPDSTRSIPLKLVTSSDFVRLGERRKLPSNFVYDQKDMWLFPLKVAKGHYSLSDGARYRRDDHAIFSTDRCLSGFRSRSAAPCRAE